jgi:hypothetical protein
VLYRLVYLGLANSSVQSSTTLSGGDLSGTISSPTLSKIQGTSISAPAGGTSSFLNASGTWTAPAGGVTLDSTNTDIQALGAQSAGSSSMAAKADHVHPTTGLITASTSLGGDLSGTAGNATVSTIGGHTPVTTSTTLTGGDLTGNLPAAHVTTVLGGSTPEITSHKNVANGYPGLNSSGLLASSQLPTGVVETTGTAGAPTSGTWLTGQAIVDSNGFVWICTSGGSPGTWVEGANGSGSVAGATSSTAGTIKLTNDLGNTYTSPEVVTVLNGQTPVTTSTTLTGGDLSGNLPAAHVSKIQGTTISTPAGGTSAFLNASGTWTTPTGSGNMNTSTYDPAGIAQQVVGISATQTLTNKSISGSQITSAVANATNAVSATSATTATNVSGTIAIGNGGTGQTTQQTALNALAGTQSAGKYLRSDGTNTSLTTIQVGDVPTLNQNTTGNAATATTATSATTASTVTTIPALSGDVTSSGSSNATTVSTVLSGATPEIISHKNAANGYAGLSSGGLLSASQLPATVVTSTTTAGSPTTGSWTTGESIVDSNGIVWYCTTSGTPGTWVEGASGSGGGSSSPAIIVNTTSLTGTTTLPAGHQSEVDTTSGSVTVNLPTGSSAGTLLSVEKVDATTNTVNISGNIRGVGSSTLSLTGQHETILFVADSTGSWWVEAGHKPISMLDARYAPQQPAIVWPVGGVLGGTISTTPGTAIVYGRRVIIPRSGTLTDLSLYFISGVANVYVGVYDTGDASIGYKTLLGVSGNTAIPTGGNIWGTFSVTTPVGGNPVVLKAQQQIDLAIVFNTNTPVFSEDNFNSAAEGQLPSSFLPAPGGAPPKLSWSYSMGSYATLPTSVQETTTTNAVKAPALIARIV